MGFVIPERHRSFLVDLSSVSDIEFQPVVDALQSLEPIPFRSPPDLAQLISEAGWSREDARTLVSALLGMLTSTFTHSIPVQDFAAGVAASPELDVHSVQNRELLKRRIATLLSIPAVQASAKAIDVATSSERNFHTARIFTQIRPIFGEDVHNPPIGAAVLHELHIHTLTEDDSERTFVTALSAQNIALLKQLIERAIAKEASLTQWLSSVGLTGFDIETEWEEDDAD